jgi:hypothetical protein
LSMEPCSCPAQIINAIIFATTSANKLKPSADDLAYARLQ